MRIYLATLTALVLAACNNGTPETTQAQNNPPSEAAVAAPAAPISINSSDNAVSFIPDNDFEDKMGDATFMPTDADAQNVTLLQYDIERNLTLSAVNQGKAKDATTVLSNLKDAIEGDKSLSNVKMGEIANNQLPYSFSNGEANESCITALNSNQDITTVCATSTDLSGENLQQWLNGQIQFH